MNQGWRLGLLAASIFIGVLFPPIAALFKPYLMLLIFLLFLCAVLQVSFAEVTRVALRERVSWLALVWQLLVLPLILFVCLKPMLPDQLYIFAVVSMCTGAITATTALCRIFNLNSALSLVVGMMGAVLMPVPLYLFLNVLSGMEVQLELSDYLVRIAIFILLPILITFVLRRLLSVEQDAWLKEQMPGTVLILLVFFALAVMDGVGELLRSNPLLLLSYVVLAFGLSLGVQLLSYYTFLFFGRRDATTVALLCAYRNMGTVAAIAGSSLGEQFFIFVGVWQLPMYLLPWLLRRQYQLRHSL